MLSIKLLDRLKLNLIHEKFIVTKVSINCVFSLFVLSCLFHFKYIRNWPTEPASDSLKTDVTKKINISWTETHPQAVKSNGKLIYYCHSTKTLPLASYKQSFSIFCQLSLFTRVSAKVFLRWHLHVFPKHDNPYVDGIHV